MRGYPATVTSVTVSGNGMGPRIRWGVACTPQRPDRVCKQNLSKSLKSSHFTAPNGRVRTRTPIGGFFKVAHESEVATMGVQQPRANAKGERRPVPHLPSSHRVRHRTYA